MALITPIQSSDVTTRTHRSFSEFRPSGDYEQFRAQVILPEVCRDRIRREGVTAGARIRHPVTYSPNRESLDSLRQLILETQHNLPKHSARIQHPIPEGNMSARVPLDIIYPVTGHFSRKLPHCFMVEGGHFEVGSRVVLGSGGRMVRVMGVCGVGRDHYKMKVSDEDRLLDGEVRVTLLVARHPPALFKPSLLQWVVLFFRRFLKTFMEYEGVEEASSGSSLSGKFFSGSEEEGSL